MSTLSGFLGGGVKSVQRGSFTFTGGGGTITINPVDPNKSVVIVSQRNSSFRYDYGDRVFAYAVHCGVHLQDATTLAYSSNDLYGTSTGTCYWQVVEFA